MGRELNENLVILRQPEGKKNCVRQKGFNFEDRWQGNKHENDFRVVKAKVSKCKRGV